MDNTEAYRIIFTKLPEELANAKVIGQLWNTISEETSKTTGIYIPAQVYEMIYACGKSADCNGPTETAIMVTTIRNPAFYTDPEGYRNALFAIVREMRTVLNQPYLSVDVYSINYMYFEPKIKE